MQNYYIVSVSPKHTQYHTPKLNVAMGDEITAYKIYKDYVEGNIRRKELSYYENIYLTKFVIYEGMIQAEFHIEQENLNNKDWYTSAIANSD